MNREDVIRMAREVGISKPWDQEPVKWETLECFAALVAAAERERILDMCKEGLWDGEGIRSQLEKREQG